MQNFEKKFVKWLQGEVKTTTPLYTYPKALRELIPNKLNEINESMYDNLFECRDLEYLNKIYKRLSSKGDLELFNKSTKNQLPSAAIKKYIYFLKELDEVIIDPLESHSDKTFNQILYGPPGTGKTYNTINRALSIIDGEVPENREEAKARFEELKKSGQIEFVTFHQSYGYEEFVEGIKAKTIDGEISYDVEPGIFKKLCNEAIQKFQHNKKDEIYRLEKFNSKIIARMKKLDNGNFRVLKNSKIRKDETPSFNAKNIKEEFLAHAKYLEDDFCYILEEDYDFNTISGASAVVTGSSSNGNIDWQLEEVLTNKNYIIIIDEINRGNISKIFGELITLIEPSKRIGASEGIQVKLPYSNDMFGVPKNLYIIGTMNTADRSIALLDTALRRRFEFVEMMPDVELLDFEVEGISLKELVTTINARVEYLYDRDHTIGHAYFMELDKNSSLNDLDTVFKNKIIPLLQEYFYDDWEKILLVLNDGFIERKVQKANKIFDKIDDEYIEEDKFLYTIEESFHKEAYLQLCKTR